MRLTIVVAALSAVVAGCQTRITAEKNPEQVVPIEEVVTVNGEQRVIVRDVVRASGGWSASARSPLWAAEAIRGLEIGVETNGAVRMSVADYSRDLSTNAVVMTQVMVEGAVQLADRICEAVTASGQAKASEKAAQALAAQFVAKGGDPAKATVGCEGGLCTVTDGATCVGGLCSE